MEDSSKIFRRLNKKRINFGALSMNNYELNISSSNRHLMCFKNFQKLKQNGHLFLLSLLVTIRLFISSPFFYPVPHRDSGVFLYIGRQILNGKIPYRDMWDHKAPLIYYFDALGLILGNGSYWGVWLLEYTVILFSIICFYCLIRDILSPKSALFASLVWLVGFSNVSSGNIDAEYSVLISLAIIFIFQKHRNAPISIFLIGLLTGIGVLLRLNEFSSSGAALFLIFLEIFRKRNFNLFAKSFVYLTTGLLIPILLILAFFWNNGALNDFYSAAIFFNSIYITRGTSIFMAFGVGLLYHFVPILFAGLSIFIAIREKFQFSKIESRELFFFGLVWLSLALPLSVLTGRLYAHYYISWIFPLAILSGFIPIYFLEKTNSSASRLFSFSMVMLWFIITIAVIGSLSPSLEKFYGIILNDKTSPKLNQAVSDIIKQVPLNQSVIMWGNETAYLLSANREISGRFIYLTPLLTPGYGEIIAAEYLNNIVTNKPMILDTSTSDSWIPQLVGYQIPSPWLRKILGYIRQNYDPHSTSCNHKKQPFQTG
ncbi:MAG: glycosyltransferase family 39 protein [Chloroflexota bacterium]